jgi:hypothetical protein
MKIELVLSVMNPEDADADNPTGLTNAAFELLTETLSSIGYEIDEGPDKLVGA